MWSPNRDDGQRNRNCKDDDGGEGIMKPLTRSDMCHAVKSARSAGRFRPSGALARPLFSVLLALAALLFLAPGRGNAQKAHSRRSASRAASTQSSATAKSEAAETGDAVRGKKLYVSDGCYECHGYYGQGSPGPRLAPNPVPMSDFTDELRQPVNAMPPYTSKVVSDRDVRDIYAFLESLPKPPPAASIPELH
jgi:mono/diheme cytochrome c family protein